MEKILMKKFGGIVLLLLLAGCAARGAHVTVEDGPGFFGGLWHGMIAPIAFVAHLFVDSIAVYASPNNGGWYDFGFLLGVGAFSFGATSSAR